MKRESLKQIALAALAMAMTFAAVLLCPFLAFLVNRLLPRQVGNFLFFLPQYVFPFVVTYPPTGPSRVATEPVGGWADVALWVIVTLVFAGAVSRGQMSLRRIGASAVTTVIVIVCAVHLVI